MSIKPSKDSYYCQ